MFPCFYIILSRFGPVKSGLHNLSENGQTDRFGWLCFCYVLQVKKCIIRVELHLLCVYYYEVDQRSAAKDSDTDFTEYKYGQ